MKFFLAFLFLNVRKPNFYFVPLDELETILFTETTRLPLSLLDHLVEENGCWLLPHHHFARARLADWLKMGLRVQKLLSPPLIVYLLPV